MQQTATIEHTITTSSGKQATAKSVITLIGLREWVNKGMGGTISLGGGRVPVEPSVTKLDIPITSINGSWAVVARNNIDVENDQLINISELRAVSERLSKPVTITELGISDKDILWTYAHIYDIAGNSSAITAEVGEVLRVNIRITVNTRATETTIPVKMRGAHQYQGMSISAVRVYLYYGDTEAAIGKGPNTSNTSSTNTTGNSVTQNGIECMVPQNELNSENPIKGIYTIQGDVEVFYKIIDDSLIKTNEHQLKLKIESRLENKE